MCAHIQGIQGGMMDGWQAWQTWHGYLTVILASLQVCYSKLCNQMTKSKFQPKHQAWIGLTPLSEVDSIGETKKRKNNLKHQQQKNCWALE